MDSNPFLPPAQKLLFSADLNVGTRKCCIDAKIARIMHCSPLLMTLILTLCHKSIHRWNQFCKGFILVHFGPVAFVVHLGLLGLCLCTSTIGIGTTYWNEPKNYPPKRCTSATTIILMLCSKLMHQWNPLCKGFILSHFGWACCVGQHCILQEINILLSTKNELNL